jgi:hypothetical protein
MVGTAKRFVILQPAEVPPGRASAIATVCDGEDLRAALPDTDQDVAASCVKLKAQIPEAKSSAQIATSEREEKIATQ